MPTLGTSYQPATNWTTTTTPKTASVTVAASEYLFQCILAENGGATFAAPTGGTSVSWTAGPNIGSASQAKAALFYSTPSAQTFTLSQARGGVAETWGFATVRISGVSGVGTPVSTVAGGSQPSLSITTTQANSGILVLISDFTAVAGTSYVYRQVNGLDPTPIVAGIGVAGSTYRGWVFYYTDAGAAGAKTVGMTTPSGQAPTMIAIEVKGTAGGSPQTVTADVASLVLSGVQPTASASGAATTTADVAALTLAGQTPTGGGTDGGAGATLDVAALTLSGQTLAAAGSGATSQDADPAALSLSGQDAPASATGSASVTADPGTLTLTGQTPTGSGTGNGGGFVDVASLSLSGQTTSASGSGVASTTADTAALTVAGQTPAAAGDEVDVPADSASLGLSGVQVGLGGSGDSSVAADPGSVLLGGQDGVLTGTGEAETAADTAHLSLTGVQANLVADSVQVIVDPAALSLAGRDGVLSGDVAVVQADTALLEFLGLTPSADGSTIVLVDPAVLDLAGIDPGVAGDAVTVPVDPGLLTLTGMGLVGGALTPITITVDPAVLMLSGQSVVTLAQGDVTIGIDPAVLIIDGVTPGVIGGEEPVEGGIIGVVIKGVRPRAAILGVNDRRSGLSTVRGRARVIAVHTHRAMGD